LKKLLELFRLLLPYRRRITIAFLAIVASSAIVLAIGQGLKLVIDDGFARGEAHTLDATLATEYLRQMYRPLLRPLDQP